jgi:hypothetical protein
LDRTLEEALAMPTQIRESHANLTGGSDVGYILSAGRADVKQLRGLSLR